MELHDYLKILRKQWRLVVLCTTLAVAAALIATVRATPLYRTGVKFFVSTPAQSEDNSSAYAGGLFSQQRVKSYAKIVSGPSTAETIAASLGITKGEVQGRISAQAVPDTVLLDVGVVDSSPERALAIATAVAREFPGIVADLEEPAGGASPIKISVSERPELPGASFSPRPVRNVSLALILGLLLGVGLAVLRDVLDNTIKGPEDIRASAATATLGAISFDPNAKKRPLIVHDQPRAARAEAFRQLRTNLQFIEIDRPLRSFVLTSSVPSEGKSTMACNLALTLAQAGISVCLVEGDLRRPRIADYLGLEGAIGVTNVVIGKTTVDEALQKWGDGSLTVLASGPIPPNPSELLSSRGMHTLIEQLERRFSVVMIDAPPLLPVTDAAILASITDGAVLVVHSGRTRKDQLRTATDALRAVNATILGCVLNMIPARGRDAYYGYGRYGYGSYESTTEKPQMSDADAQVAARDMLPTGRSDRAQQTPGILPSPGVVSPPPKQPAPNPTATPSYVGQPRPNGGSSTPVTERPAAAPTHSTTAPTGPGTPSDPTARPSAPAAPQHSSPANPIPMGAGPSGEAQPRPAGTAGSPTVIPGTVAPDPATATPRPATSSVIDSYLADSEAALRSLSRPTPPPETREP